MEIRVAVSRLTSKPMAEWSVRAAQAIHELHFKIGLRKALAGATEEQTIRYCERLHEYALDWSERHNAVLATFDVEIALKRVKMFLTAEVDRWPNEHRHILFDRMAQVFASEDGRSGVNRHQGAP